MISKTNPKKYKNSRRIRPKYEDVGKLLYLNVFINGKMENIMVTDFDDVSNKITGFVVLSKTDNDLKLGKEIVCNITHVQAAEELIHMNRIANDKRAD